MGAAKIEVTVVSGGRHVDGPIQRPIRLTPDRVAGIVYGGLVYPVRNGNVVDLDDAPFDKYDCDTFLEAGESIPYATGGPAVATGPLPVERWHVDCNKFGNYLVLDGPESVAEAVVDRLGNAGFEIVRWDASHRPADDGYFYDWFVRFRYSGSVAEALDEIEDVLGATRSDGTVHAPDPDSRAESQRRLDTARAEVRVLRQQLAESLANERAASAALSAEQETTTQLTEAASALQKHVHALLSKTADLEMTLVRERAARAASLPAAVREQLEADLKRLQCATDDAVADWVDAQASAEALQTERDSLRTENARLRVQADEARARSDELSSLLEEATSESAESARREVVNRHGRKTRHSTYEFLAKLFPRLCLDPDGIDDLLEFPRPSSTVEALFELQRGQRLPKTSKVESAKSSMFEIRKINTGESGDAAMGRIYYALRSDGSLAGRVHRKHDKKEQDRIVQAFDGRIDDLDPALDSDRRQAG